MIRLSELHLLQLKHTFNLPYSLHYEVSMEGVILREIFKLNLKQVKKLLIQIKKNYFLKTQQNLNLIQDN